MQLTNQTVTPVLPKLIGVTKMMTHHAFLRLQYKYWASHLIMHLPILQQFNLLTLTYNVHPCHPCYSSPQWRPCPAMYRFRQCLPFMGRPLCSTGMCSKPLSKSLNWYIWYFPVYFYCPKFWKLLNNLSTVFYSFQCLPFLSSYMMSSLILS